MKQKIGWKPILSLLTISMMLFSCNIEEIEQEKPSITHDKTVSQETITLSLRLTGNGFGRSASKTSLGTFRNITKINVNAKRKNRLSLIYPDPGLALSQTGDEWKGTLTGLIQGESYTFFISALNSDETEIFRGETDHQVVSGNNAINITLYPVQNNLVVAVPVIRQIIMSETIGEQETTKAVASVEMSDNSSIDWNFMPYTNQNGFAISCQAETCGSFSPGSGTISPSTADNVTLSDSVYTYILKSNYTSPANNTPQLLRLQVTNETGIGAETRFSIKVVGDVSSALQFKAAPSVLKMIVARVQDDVICPGLDCLAFEAFVDDDKPFSELQAEWSYPAQSTKIFGGLDNHTHSDPLQGYFRSVMSGYEDSDSGQVILKIHDSDGLIGQINFPLFPDAYPLTRLCLSAGQCSLATFGESIFGESYFSATP